MAFSGIREPITNRIPVLVFSFYIDFNRLFSNFFIKYGM
jgi:hypothetical protein